MQCRLLVDYHVIWLCTVKGHDTQNIRLYNTVILQQTERFQTKTKYEFKLILTYTRPY